MARRIFGNAHRTALWKLTTESWRTRTLPADNLDDPEVYLLGKGLAEVVDGRLRATPAGFDRATGRVATEIAVPHGAWSAARQIANVPASDPDLLGSYSLTDAQVRQIATVAQIILDGWFEWVLEAS